MVVEERKLKEQITQAESSVSHWKHRINFDVCCLKDSRKHLKVEQKTLQVLLGRYTAKGFVVRPCLHCGSF